MVSSTAVQGFGQSADAQPDAKRCADPWPEADAQSSYLFGSGSAGLASVSVVD
ncbi:hypothetical protein ACFL5O_04105 [Myxococcota bacterium]